VDLVIILALILFINIEFIKFYTLRRKV